jgi:hypothetical protein
VADLEREIARRSRTVRSLMKRRAKAAARLDEIDQLIAKNGGSAGGRGSGGGGKRVQNEFSLVETLAKVLKGKTMAVKDAAEAVKRSGYRTNAANFRTMVNIALIKNPKAFKKMGRGEYTAA